MVGGKKYLILIITAMLIINGHNKICELIHKAK